MIKRIVWIFLFLCYCALRVFSQSLELPPDSVSKYYTVENIPLPEGLSGETGGIAFMPDGRLIACFRRGEVMTYQPQIKEWKLFAQGLHDPLGITAVSNSEILVMQRPELTRIKDTDGDGLADLYETITDDFGMTGNYHEFAFGPLIAKDGSYFISLNLASNGAGIRDELRGQYDSLGRQGRMYSCVPYRGWVLKVSKDGKVTPWACGFRSPNGLGFDKEGNLFVSDNQGDWIGTSTLHHVEQGKFYGHPSSLIWKEDFPDVNPLTLPVSKLSEMRTKAAMLFPQGMMANSPTQSVTDNTGGKFGPFTGQMLIGEMDYSRIMRLMLEKVDGQIQGACVDLYFGNALRKGNNRLQFAPDGSLWIGQTDHGWVGSQGIQRISWNGKVPMEILSMNVTPQGFDLTFTHPVDKSVAGMAENYQFKRYYYNYHKEYGSKQMDLQPVKVTNVQISPDGKKVSLRLAEMKPGYVYEMQVQGMKSHNQLGLLNNTVYYTLNVLKK
jgi:glucose/arabinose dehydrogenase